VSKTLDYIVVHGCGKPGKQWTFKHLFKRLKLDADPQSKPILCNPLVFPLWDGVGKHLPFLILSLSKQGTRDGLDWQNFGKGDRNESLRVVSLQQAGSRQLSQK
jgi:hypothetical protein